MCGRTGRAGGCAEIFVSVERGLFTINTTSCVESVPARVRWTGGYQPCVDRCTYVTLSWLACSQKHDKTAIIGSTRHSAHRVFLRGVSRNRILQQINRAKRESTYLHPFNGSIHLKSAHLPPPLHHHHPSLSSLSPPPPSQIIIEREHHHHRSLQRWPRSEEPTPTPIAGHAATTHFEPMRHSLMPLMRHNEIILVTKVTST
jgi:hypothetical protein